MSRQVRARIDAFAQLILARFREFYREPEVVFWVYGFPLILATVLGIAFASSEPVPPTVDVESPAIGPPDDGQRAKALADSVVITLKTAKLTATLQSPADSRKRLRKGKTDLVIVPHEAGVEYVYDPARDKSVLARYWVDSVLAREEVRALGRQPNASRSVDVKDTLLREPGSRYIDFLLPGLLGINIMGGGLFGVGFVLVDMRVRKLFKRLLATPMHRGDFLFSLLTARMFFLLPEMFTLLLVGWLAFGVMVQGSLFTLLLVILSGAFAFAGIGLLLGCRTEKTESISGLINLVMLPMYLLAGVFFPSERFPEIVQPVIRCLPLTQLNDALREVMLDGAGLAETAGRIGILVVWAVVTFSLALRWFRWK
jgi:ABC-type multidrug transport system permease subunit